MGCASTTQTIAQPVMYGPNGVPYYLTTVPPAAVRRDSLQHTDAQPSTAADYDPLSSKRNVSANDANPHISFPFYLFRVRCPAVFITVPLSPLIFLF